MNEWIIIIIIIINGLLVAVLCFVYSFEATAQQRLDEFSPNLHQKTSLRFVNSDTPWKSVPKNFRAQNVHFWSENSAVFVRPRGAETRRNSGKTKNIALITISRLSSHPRLVKFGSGTFELWGGLINCAFWPFYKANENVNVRNVEWIASSVLIRRSPFVLTILPMDFTYGLGLGLGLQVRRVNTPKTWS